MVRRRVFPSTRSSSKYGNEKITDEDGKFDSKKEWTRWQVLKGMQNAGLISDLKRQTPFLLIEEQREPDTIGKKGGIHKGKVIERACYYIADFTYTDGGKLIVEDVKGWIRTPEYRIKKKLMLARYGIHIQEI